MEMLIELTFEFINGSSRSRGIGFFRYESSRNISLNHLDRRITLLQGERTSAELQKIIHLRLDGRPFAKDDCSAAGGRHQRGFAPAGTSHPSRPPGCHQFHGTLLRAWLGSAVRYDDGSVLVSGGSLTEAGRGHVQPGPTG